MKVNKIISNAIHFAKSQITLSISVLTFLFSSICLTNSNTICAQNTNFIGSTKDLKYTSSLNFDLKGKSLSEFLVNKIVVIDFWATWCGPCISGMPSLLKLSEKYSSDSVEFILFTNDNSKKVSDFISSRKITAKCLIDTTHFTWRKLRITEIPNTVLINKNGEVVWKGPSQSINESAIMEFLSNGKLHNDLIKDSKTNLVSQNIVDELKYSSGYTFKSFRSDSLSNFYLRWNLGNQNNDQWWLNVNAKLSDFVAMNMLNFTKPRILSNNKGDYMIQVQYSAPKIMFDDHEAHIVNQLSLIHNFKYFKKRNI